MKPTAPVATKTKSRRRPRLTSDLAAAILSHIRTERLPGGHHLPVQDLADRLDVSRPPVALALQALADQGVVRHEANRGYFVVDHTGSQTTGAEEMAPLRSRSTSPTATMPAGSRR